MNEEALAIAIQKVRKLRMVGHVAVKDAAPPAITVLALMKSGLGALYDDAAIEFMFRRFMTYYEAEIHPPETDQLIGALRDRADDRLCAAAADLIESAQPQSRTEPAKALETDR